MTNTTSLQKGNPNVGGVRRQRSESASVLKEGGEWMGGMRTLHKEEESRENAFFFFDPRSSDCYPLPDEKDTVVEIFLKEGDR